MMKMSDLPKDMEEEEVLCRVPLTSLRRVRSTCKKWNALSKDRSFAEKHLARQAKEFKVVMMINYTVYLMGVAESGIIKREAKLNGSDQIDVCQVFHCEGLLLCISEDNTKLVVWNPYLGQTRWILPTHNDQRLDRYSFALGYDKSSKSHKILRYIKFSFPAFVELKIYDFNSDSWRVLDATMDWEMKFYHRGVSLKGNTYWYATETREFKKSFLVCFDFTRETFGPPLPLPFVHVFEDTVSLSVSREEQLVVLFQPWETLDLEIWISDKVEPNTVSWNTKVFLSVSLNQLSHTFVLPVSSFFIDQEKQVAMVFYLDKYETKPYRYVAYIVGVNGSLKKLILGDSAHKHFYPRVCPYCYPVVCPYVPSLVQLH